jgi:hypothetical protein
MTTVMPRARKSHVWDRDPHEHYVEPAWCSERLFEEEKFRGAIHDPCCGFGTIPAAAARFCSLITCADIVDRGYKDADVRDFFDDQDVYSNIVCNPPFDIAAKFTFHALKLAYRKVAIILPSARLNAAHWLGDTPLRRVWLMTPRPSMPPGSYISAGNKPGGGRADYCWLVFEHRQSGPVELRWLHRDRENAA